MAEGLNRVMLFGNLGADPEYRTTNSGTGVLKLRLATTERYKDASGAWQDRTEWHRVVVWGKRGEALSRILSKGSTIFVEGSLRTTSYEKDGEKRYSTEINATNVLLGGRGGDGGSRAERPAQRADDEAPADPFGYAPGGHDDVPFLPERRMIFIDEITNDKAHLIQMRIEDFGRMLAQHSESVDHARRLLTERGDTIDRMRREAMELREAHDKATLSMSKDIEALRNALGAMLQIARPKGISEKEIVSEAQKLFDDTRPIPF